MLLTYNDDRPERLDVWLSEQTKRSRSFIKTCNKNQQITVNDKNVKIGNLLKQGDQINVNLSEKQLEYSPTNISLEIIFEDEHLLVINKPSGLTVHPGAGNNTNTLVNALLYYGKNLSSIGGIDRPGIVHRLDKDTSGLMVVAKNNVTHEKLAKLFAERNVIKKYLALVHGYLSEQKGEIDAPISRSQNYKKMCINIPNGKPSLTEYAVLKELNEKTLLELTLHTGRTHQIRVHLAHIGHPIVGDPLYGTKNNKGKTQLLHSYSLEFCHPITNQNLHFKTELPKWGKF